MSDVRRAIILTTAEKYIALTANFLTLAIVSRIMSPEELGVAVVGAATVLLVATAREFAGMNLIIQRESVSREEVRAAFSVAMLVTLAISLGLALCAPAAASAYGDDRLVPYLYVVSVALILETFGQTLCTLLRRDMEFVKVAAIQATGTVTSAAVLISLAYLNFSYMSFAWAWLASAVAVWVTAQILKRELWMYRPLFRKWRSLIVFGGYSGGTLLAYRIFESVPYLLLGRILSLDAAALYHRSIMLCTLPDKVFLAGVAPVVFPVFSGEVRAGRDLKPAYLRGLELITALQWPALLSLSLLAYPIVAVVLGQQWMATAPLIQIIALALLFSFSFELNYPVLVALGAIRDVFLRAIIVFPVSAGIIAAAAQFGLMAVAWSMLLTIPFQASIGLTFVRRRLGLAWWDFVVAIRKSLLVAGGTVSGPLLLSLLFPVPLEQSIPLAAVAVVLAAIGWLVALHLTRHPLLDEIIAALPQRLRSSLFQRQGAVPAGE
jgi:O-antigen/teichoic acid export membrane protein